MFTSVSAPAPARDPRARAVRVALLLALLTAIVAWTVAPEVGGRAGIFLGQPHMLPGVPADLHLDCGGIMAPC